MFKSVNFFVWMLFIVMSFVFFTTADIAYATNRYIDWEDGSNEAPGDGTIEHPWKTFGYAYTNASSGDVIYVQPNADPVNGPYVEATYLLLNIPNKNITFEGLGDSPSDTVFKGTSGQTYHVRPYKNATGSTITFRNIKILGDASQTYAFSAVDTDVSKNLTLNLDECIIQGNTNAVVLNKIAHTVTATNCQFVASGAGRPLTIQGAGTTGGLTFTNSIFSSETGDSVILTSTSTTDITGVVKFINSSFLRSAGTSVGYGIIATGLAGNWLGLEVSSSTFGTANAPYTGTGISIDEYADYLIIDNSEFHFGVNDNLNGLLIGMDGPTNDNPFGPVQITNNTIYYYGSVPAGHAVLIGSGVDSANFSNNEIYSTGAGSSINIGLVVKGESNNIYNNIISAARGIDLKGGGSNNIYNNTVYAKLLYALQFDDSGSETYATGNTLKNNIFDASDGATYTTYFSQSYLNSNINNYFDFNNYQAGSTALFYDVSGNIANLLALKSLWSGLLPPYQNSDTNSIETETQFISPGTNFTLQTLSGAIDSGTLIAGFTTSTTTDHAGNPLYGTPDIGAYEYQPPYTLGTHDIDPTGDIRIYGDGKYRYITATSSTDTVDLDINPPEGRWSYAASTTRPEWLNIVDITWTNDLKQWTASSTTATTTVYTIGDLTPNTYYTIAVDGSALTTQQANSSGIITYTYSGGYSAHTFSVTPDTTGPASFSLISPTNGASVSPNLSFSWNSATDSGSGFSHYRLYIDGILHTDNILNTSAEATNLSCGTHTWYVRAIDNQDNSTDSSTNNLTIDCGSGGGSSVASRIKNLKAMGNYKLAQELERQYSFVPIEKPSSSTNHFKRNLKLGSTGEDVRQLQIFLNNNGFTVSNKGLGSKGQETSYFGLLTRSAVIRFQETYAKDILKPLNLSRGTGIVGEKTINKIKSF